MSQSGTDDGFSRDINLKGYHQRNKIDEFIVVDEAISKVGSEFIWLGLIGLP